MISSKNQSDKLLRHGQKTPEVRIWQLHKIAEEQRCQFENLRYISLLFYLPIVLMLLHFWL